jgi:ribosomal protein L7Ae-like RNA K-turn-binding protein
VDISGQNLEQEQKNKFLQMISMCRRAGKLVLGLNNVKEGTEKKKVFLTVAAADASEKTRKEARYFSEKRGVPFAGLVITSGEIQKFTGTKAAVIGIADRNMSEKVLALAEPLGSKNNLQTEECQ